MRISPTKRGWKRMGIWLGILAAIGLLVNGLFAWRAEWKLQSRLAAIRATGQPASIAELTPKAIPDSKNAAAIIEKIRPRLNEFGKEYGQFYGSPFGRAFETAQQQGEPLTQSQIDGLRAILMKYNDVAEALAAAAACDQYASLLDFTKGHTKTIELVIDQQQSARTATRFLAWQVEVLLAEGKHEEAARLALQALRLARLHENEPTLVAYLVAMAMQGMAINQLYDALAAGPVSPELHAQIDAELARLDDPEQLANVMATERAVSADWFYSHLDNVKPVLLHTLGWWLKNYQVGVLDLMGEQVELAKRPWHEIRGQFGPANKPMSPSGQGVMADMLLPAVKAVHQANARSLAMVRGLRIDNALRQFAEKNGREAAGLEELALPTDATIDPYSGEPLKLKRTDGGWVVYSVMDNGTDDGGDFKEQKDYGVGPRKLRSVD